MTELSSAVVAAVGEVASNYGLRMSIGEHAAVARRISAGDPGALTTLKVNAALRAQGLKPPAGYAKDLIRRLALVAPPKVLHDILLEFRLDAIDALSTQYGGKPKPEENLRNYLRLYLKGQHQVEARTAKGRTDVLIPGRRAVIEVKVWTTPQKYEDGLVELGEYIRTLRPSPLQASFVLFCDDDPLPSVVTSVDEPVIDTRPLSGLDVAVIAVPFQTIAPSKKAYENRRSARGR